MPTEKLESNTSELENQFSQQKPYTTVHISEPANTKDESLQKYSQPAAPSTKQRTFGIIIALIVFAIPAFVAALLLTWVLSLFIPLTRERGTNFGGGIFNQTGEIILWISCMVFCILFVKLKLRSR
jgi:cytoskeletal protein RodZ